MPRDDTSHFIGSPDKYTKQCFDYKFYMLWNKPYNGVMPVWASDGWYGQSLLSPTLVPTIFAPIPPPPPPPPPAPPVAPTSEKDDEKEPPPFSLTRFAEPKRARNLLDVVKLAFDEDTSSKRISLQMKEDGWRVLVRVQSERVDIWSRTDNTKLVPPPRMASALHKLGDGYGEGELCARDTDGGVERAARVQSLLAGIAGYENFRFVLFDYLQAGPSHTEDTYEHRYRHIFETLNPAHDSHLDLLENPRAYVVPPFELAVIDRFDSE